MDAKHSAGKGEEKKQTSNDTGGAKEPWWIEEDRRLRLQAEGQWDQGFEADRTGLMFEQLAAAADSRMQMQQTVEEINAAVNEGIGRGGCRQAQG
jgi:hypothetical protein